MTDKITFLDIVDEVIAESIEVIDEVVQEEVEPIIKRQKEMNKKAFDKAYNEFLKLELEQEVK